MSPEPQHVNATTLLRCRHDLRENFVKKHLRIIYNYYLKKKYGMPYMGESFRWGKKWTIRRKILSVGNFVYIGSEAEILYPTVVGDLCLIASSVKFIGNDHGYLDATTPIRICPPKRDSNSVTTIIEPDTWIGHSSIVLHGVTIGRGSVIAAGSVVTKDIPPYSICAGIPARVIKTRFSKHEITEYEKRIYG